MPALVAGIHVLLSGARRQRKTWMAGTSPAMTWRGDAKRPESAVASNRSGKWCSVWLDGPRDVPRASAGASFGLRIRFLCESGHDRLGKECSACTELRPPDAHKKGRHHEPKIIPESRGQRGMSPAS